MRQPPCPLGRVNGSESKSRRDRRSLLEIIMVRHPGAYLQLLNLNYLRLGVHLHAVAEAMGISRQTFSHWLSHGHRDIVSLAGASSSWWTRETKF